MQSDLTKDPISLEDLKRAIETVGRRPFTDGSDMTTSRLCQWESRRADAWRMAFEWHVGLIARHSALSDTVGAHITDWIAIDREEDEGIALIREKLS